MQRQKILFIFLFFVPFAMSSKENSYLSKVDNGLERICEVTNYFTEFLEDFNDRHLGRSEWGRMLGYEEIKPRISEGISGRGIKKMSMAMMPLIFHVGATSTWMVLTSIMAVKSVAIGLILLIFKIAVSSAKVASFFTLLKSKQAEHHHEYSWTPHGHDSARSLSQNESSPGFNWIVYLKCHDPALEIPTHSDWNSYTPEWSHNEPHTGYKTIPTYKENHISNFEDIQYEEPNKHADKKNG